MESGGPGPYAPAWETERSRPQEPGQDGWHQPPEQAYGPGPWPPVPTGPLRTYQPLGSLTSWTVGLAVAYAAAAALGVLLNLVPFGALIGLLLVPVTWGAIIVSVIWCYRASVNAHALRGGLRWNPGWAAGAWFIPLANLVMPVLVMAEVWRASRPAPGNWPQTPLPTYFVAWWALWVAGAVASGVAAVIALISEFRAGLETAGAGAAEAGPEGVFAPAFAPGSPMFWASLVQPLFLLVALPLWIRVVRSIDEGQQRLASQQGPPAMGLGAEPSPWSPEETEPQPV